TTHSIVGAVVGVGAVAIGIENIAWGKVALITAGWIVSPLLAGIVAFVLFKILLKSVFHKEDPVSAAKKIAPYLSFVVILVLVGVAAFKGLKPLWKTLKVDLSDSGVLFFVACAALGLAFFGMLVTKRLVSGIRPVGERLSDPGGEDSTEAGISGAGHAAMQSVERIFAGLQILTASIVAFAHGSNDVANAVGPMSAAYQAISTGEISSQAGVPPWMLALGGVGIVVGLLMWGWRVIETIGKRITELTPSRGFVSEFAAAIVILLASILPFGLPVSTTHTLVGAVIGVGLARGIGAIDLSVARVIVTSWMITIPAGATLSIGFYFMLKAAIL
ncbi:MAG: inorganic phosphate transporter, partial [bacterium]